MSAAAGECANADQERGADAPRIPEGYATCCADTPPDGLRPLIQAARAALEHRPRAAFAGTGATGFTRRAR